jgi:hypothetical protein
MTRFAIRGFAFGCAVLGACVDTAGRPSDGTGGGTNTNTGSSSSGTPGATPGAGLSSMPLCPGRDASVVSAPPDSANPPAAAGPYVWQNVAIVAGGFVTGIVFSRAQADVIYARTDIGGAYRWNAATSRWMPLLDWVGRSQQNFGGVESIAADPTDANKVYVAAGTYVTSGSGAILISNDRGATFTTVSTSIPMGSNNDGRSVGERLAVDPNQPSTLYFGSRTTGLWKSADSGETWSQVTSLPGLTASDGGAATGPATTPNGVGITFVVFDTASCAGSGPTAVYVGEAVSGPSVYRSTDGGATWSPIANQPTGLLSARAALSSSGQLYVTYGGGTGNNGDGPNNVTKGAVYRLDTASSAWTNVSPTSASTTTFGYAGVSVDAAHPDTVVVSTIDRWGAGDDVFRSTDGGGHWAEAGIPGSPHDVTNAPWVTFHQTHPDYTGWMGDVEIDPFDSKRVLHTTGQGIWATDDITPVDTGGQASWDFRDLGIEETAVNDLASPPAGGATLLSAVGDIGGFRHDDLTKSPTGGMSSNPVFSSTDGIDFAGMAPSIVARVGRGAGNAMSAAGATVTTASGAYSTDGGSTWFAFATEIPISSSSAGTIAVSADGSTFVWDATANTTAGSAAGPRYSRDKGQTWTASTGATTARVVIADKVDPQKFYAFDGSTGTGRILVSTDGGATFTPGATGLSGRTGRMRATVGIAGDLWIVANGTAYHSTDGGMTTTALAAASGVYAMGTGMAAPGQSYPALFVGGTVMGNAGLFRSDDLGATWTQIDDPAHRFATAGTVIGDPKTYGRVYVGNNGRGILYGDIAH